MHASPTQRFALTLTALAVLSGVWVLWQTYGSTGIGFTLRSNASLEEGLIAHWTLDAANIVETASGNALNRVGYTSTTTKNVATTTMWIEKPTGVAEGDLLLYFSTTDTNTSSRFMRPDGEFTEIATGWLGTGSATFWLGYRIAGASEPSWYQATTSDAGSDNAAGALVAVRGQKASDFFVYASSTYSSYTPYDWITLPTATTTIDNALIYAFFGTAIGCQSYSTSTPDGEYTLLAEGNTNVIWPGACAAGQSTYHVLERQATSSGGYSGFASTTGTTTVGAPYVSYHLAVLPGDASSTASASFAELGGGVPATLAGGAGATIGAIGGGVILRGVDGYINAGDLSATAKTIAFWAKLSTSTASQKLVNIDSGNTDYIETNGSSNVVATGFPGATVYVNGSSASANVGTAGQWYHVVVTDPTGVSVTDFEVGRVGTTYGGFSVDDVRLYDRALSAKEITRLYQLGATTRIGNTLTASTDLESGLVGHWSFDSTDVDLSQVTAEIRDRSGQGFHGDWRNHATTTVPGAIGQALYFDGVDDYVYIGSAYNGVKSIGLWFYTNATGTQLIEFNATQAIEIGESTVTTHSITSPTVYVDGVKDGTFGQGAWHHVLVTTDTGINASVVQIPEPGDGAGTTDTGWVTAGTGSSVSFTGADHDWNGPSSITADDAIYASTTEDAPPGEESYYLRASNFGLSVPAGATINGVEVRFEGYETNASDNQLINHIKLVNASGAVTAADKATSAELATTPTVYSFGGASDTWGETLTTTYVNDTDFGFVFSSLTAAGGDARPFVDVMQMKVTYTEASSKFSGNFDDFRMYNRTLSASEAKRLYQLGATTRIGSTITSRQSLDSGLVGHWTFDGKNMDMSNSNEIRDRSPTGAHCGSNNGYEVASSTVPGVMGQAVDLNSSGNIGCAYALLGSAFDFGTTTDFSISFWMRRKENPASNETVLWRLSGGGWRALLNTDGQMYWTIGDDVNPNANGFGNPANYLTDGNWHHVGLAVDRSSDAHMYYDGIEHNVFDVSYLGSVNNTAGILMSLASGGFQGHLDDVRVYNRLLSTAEMRQLYQMGK